MNTYEVGDQVRLTVTFTDTAGVVADPTAVTILVKRRDGATTTFTYAGSSVTKSSTGVYYADYTVTEEGNYDYRMVGTGAVVAAVEGFFQVPDSGFFP